MKAAGVAKLYDNLRLDELFRLRLQALARRDLVECARIDRACPPSQYPRYVARIEASDVLTLCALVDLLPKLAKLHMVDALRPVVDHLEGKIRDVAWLSYLDGYEAGWHAAGGHGEPPEVTDDALEAVADRATPAGPCFSDVLDQIESHLAATAKTTQVGMAQFAESRLGLSVDVLYEAWGQGTIENLASLESVLGAATADADELVLFERVLDLAWRKHGLLDRHAEPDDELREIVRSRGWDA